MAIIVQKTFEETLAEFNGKLTSFGSQITNRLEGGAYDLLIRTFCLMLADAYKINYDSVTSIGFVSRASGAWLDLHAEAVGLTRHPASKAQKEFVVSVTDAVTGTPLQIEIGGILKTPVLPNRGTLRWIAIQSSNPAIAEGYAGQIEVGQKSTTIICEADDTGSSFNSMETLLDVDYVEMTIEQGFDNIDLVMSNGNDLLAGAEIESDEELRERTISRWAEIARGATRKAYINFAKDADPRVDSANAFKGTGATDVKIVLGGPPGARSVLSQLGIKVYSDNNFDSLYTVEGTAEGTACPLSIAVHEYIRERAPLTDFIYLESATETEVDIDVDIQAAEGFDIEELKTLVTTRLRALFRIEEGVSDVAPLEVGEALKFSTITRILNDTPGVYDFIINTPDQNGYAANDLVAYTDGTITVGEI
jgi:uncharacterized phage protein gp47/JayE